MTGPPRALDFEAVEATTWDVLVVGAGPSGALAARELALGGARVLLVERSRFPRWKVCGACLNGRALAALESAGLGSLVDRLGGVGLDAFRIGLKTVSTRLALPAGKAVSRASLDAGLVAEALASGAHFLPETQARIDAVREGVRTVRLVHQGRGRMSQVAARVVLAASGLGSLATERDAPAPRSTVATGSRVGAGCVVTDAPALYEAHTIHMAVGRDGYVGLVRVEDGSLNVAAAFQPRFLKELGTPALAAASVLAEAGFPPIDALDDSHWQGTAGLTRSTRPLSGDRVFVIGDAAGYVEPFTGEGMAWAFVSAQAVAPLALRAVERWSPGLAREWSDLHDRLVRRRQRVCRALAATLRRPWLAHSALCVVARFPALAGSVLTHLNAPPMSRKWT